MPNIGHRWSPSPTWPLASVPVPPTWPASYPLLLSFQYVVVSADPTSPLCVNRITLSTAFAVTATPGNSMYCYMGRA